MIKGFIATLFIPLWLFMISFRICRRKNQGLYYSIKFGLDCFKYVRYKDLFIEFSRPTYPWKNIFNNYKNLLNLILDKQD